MLINFNNKKFIFWESILTPNTRSLTLIILHLKPNLSMFWQKLGLLKPMFNKKCLILSLYFPFISIFPNTCIKNDQLNLFYQYHTVSWDLCDHTCTQAHMQVSLCVHFIIHTKSQYFNFLFYYYIFLVKRTFPNMVCALHGKTFCLNCSAECLKHPFKLDLYFESKYFVIPVANQLNQNSFMNCWLNLQTVCTHI